MNHKTILFSFFAFCSSSAAGQAKLITFNTQANPDKTISIYSNSQAYGEYTVKLLFTSLSGFTSRSLTGNDMALLTVNRGNAEMIKFTRESNSFGNPSLQYKSQYFPGRALRKMPDSTFEYTLPASAGKSIKVTAVSSTVSQLSQKLKSDYRATGFAYQLADTICASRAGIVFLCSDTAMEGEKKETAYKSGRNRVEVQHRDGTLGIYGISAPIQLLVKPGDDVFPGQPLAVFNKESDKYRVYFATCYLDETKLLADNSFDNNFYYTYLPTHFYANENEPANLLTISATYTAQHPAAIISKEMTKKEKKKLGY